jgi:hypothetical protein
MINSQLSIADGQPVRCFGQSLLAPDTGQPG